MQNDLRTLRDTLVANLNALEADSTLTQRQCQRLTEITQAANSLSDAIDKYYAAPSNRHDPRYRLMYAARTPLAMIHMATYLLGVYHERQSETFTLEQRTQVRMIDECGRRIVIEVERLWAQMEIEQSRV